MNPDRHTDPPTPDGRLSTLRSALAERDAAAFVHAGPAGAPSIRYCLALAEAESSETAPTATASLQARPGRYAVAVTADDVVVRDSGSGSHPGESLASHLASRGRSGTILTPATIPHDAALFLERAGFALASSDALARARARKAPTERARLVDAQAAAAQGIRRAASVLAGATVADERLTTDGDHLKTVGGRPGADDDHLTGEGLRRVVDAAVVTAGAFPGGNTTVGSPVGPETPLRAGEPIVVSLAPQSPSGYHGGLVRTLVVDSDGGWDRRAQVALESAFRSVATMLDADDATAGAVEAELLAEIRSFGFGSEVTATASGVGLERRERPSATGDTIDDGTVVRIEAAVGTEDGAGEVRLGDLLERRDGDAGWLSGPPRSLDPATVAAESVTPE